MGDSGTPILPPAQGEDEPSPAAIALAEAIGASYRYARGSPGLVGRYSFQTRIIAELAEAGYKIVAREPSQAMIKAGLQEHYPAHLGFAAVCWRAMWGVAP